MCEFCVKHGDGRKWYLNASNYMEELLADAARQRYIEDFIPQTTATAGRWLKIFDRARRTTPALAARVAAVQTRRMKSVHFGQVIPIEDVAEVMGLVARVDRLPCVCRTVLEKREEGVCYMLSASPTRLGQAEIMGRREEAGPFLAGLERVEPARAVEEMAALEDGRRIHTIWTFLTPFIGGICNCDPRGCLAMNFTRRGLRVYHRGEGVMTVDPERCVGCGACLEACLFSALSVKEDRAVVDDALCEGCGICRRACGAGALALVSRAPAA
jgi:ferredoxin